MSDYTHILVATDLSPDADLVLERAMALAKRVGAEVTLLHVAEPVPVDMPTDFILPERAELEEYILDSSRDRLEALAKTWQLDPEHWSLEVGSAKKEIVRYAQEHGVDLIIVGSHGRHGLELLLGSTANAVLHIAPCDVLAVRIGRESSND